MTGEPRCLRCGGRKNDPVHMYENATAAITHIFRPDDGRGSTGRPFEETRAYWRQRFRQIGAEMARRNSLVTFNSELTDRLADAVGDWFDVHRADDVRAEPTVADVLRYMRAKGLSWQASVTDVELALEALGASAPPQQLERWTPPLRLDHPVEGESGWRSIESAPKDGSQIIVARGDMVIAARWSERLGGWTPSGEGLLPWGPPTHWMPLPSPPIQEPSE